MEEFFKENYVVLTKLVVFTAFFSGLLTYKKFKGTVIRSFIWFLLAVVLIEFIASYPRMLLKWGRFDLIEGLLIERNYWWYTLSWTTGSALYFSFFFRKVITNKILKTILRIGFMSMIAAVVITLIVDYRDFFSGFPVLIEVVSFLVVIVSTISYFIEILLTDKILSFYKSVSFYISCAILFWWLVNTPLVFFEVYNSTADWNFIFLKWQIRLFSNVVTYLTFTFALLWCKPQNV